LAESSGQLAEELDTNPLLQTDNELRMFCLIVKGDIDTEIDTQAMGQDWEQVQALARELSDSKWQNRALAQLGLAAFYKGDIETARKNVGTALLAATKAGDKGAQIRYLTMIGFGLVASNMFEQAILYFEQALKIAEATPDAGYQFVTQVARLTALTGLGKLDAAQQLANDILTHAQPLHQISHQVAVLDIVAQIAQDHNDKQAALAALEQSVALSESAGFIRGLSDAQSLIADVYRKSGDLTKAEQFATQAAASTQASGNSWEVPQRLQALAELQVYRVGPGLQPSRRFHRRHDRQRFKCAGENRVDHGIERDILGAFLAGS
jgi:tetratricopeptide (TPR) repeat protein